MLNKILVFGGIAIFAIMFIENLVVPYSAYVLWLVSKSYILCFASTLVGISIGYGLGGYSKVKTDDFSDNDF